MEGMEFVCFCKCGGQVVGVRQFGRLFTACDKCSIVVTRTGTGNDDTGRLLSPAEVASRLDVSIRTLWRLEKAGKIAPAIRKNRKLVRWREEDVAAFIQGNAPHIGGDSGHA